jgi:predicted nucleic acid-binding protein
MVPELAVEARCECIVTFNRKDFAAVEKQFGIRVLGPKEFLEEIGRLP